MRNQSHRQWFREVTEGTLQQQLLPPFFDLNQCPIKQKSSQKKILSEFLMPIQRFWLIFAKKDTNPNRQNLKQNAIWTSQATYQKNSRVSIKNGRGTVHRTILGSFYLKRVASVTTSLQLFRESQTMEKNTLTPISFIKSEAIRQRYQCGICLEVCVKPLICKGSCKRIYCMKCISDWKQCYDICPYKCSSPFHLEPIPDISLEFFCPYAATDCSLPIMSLKAFGDHYLTCPFVPPEEVQRLRLKHQYKCLNGHQLEFFIGTYHQMLGSSCSQCKNQKLCRSICRICDELYCVECRVPPCSKQDCPIGHKFNYQKTANLNYICDICGVSTSVSNDGVYDDPFCNFGLCQACYDTLPEHFDPSKPRDLIANINNRCSCGGDLKMMDSIHKLHICSLCMRQKQCPKQCSKCQKFFCIKCKMMEIETDKTCVKEQHQLKLLDLKKYPPKVQLQNEYGCMRCLKKDDQYYFDVECRVRLCKECMDYFMKTTADKKRSIPVKCNMNHILNYVGGQNAVVEKCSQCHQLRIIKLRCFVCCEENKEIGLPFCFQCKPIKLDTCYYEHKLKHKKFNGERHCHFCFKVASEFHCCQKCPFYVCLDCIASNKQKFQQMEIEQDPVSSEEMAKVEKMQQQHQQMEEQIASIKIQ